MQPAPFLCRLNVKILRSFSPLLTNNVEFSRNSSNPIIFHQKVSTGSIAMLKHIIVGCARERSKPQISTDSLNEFAECIDYAFRCQWMANPAIERINSSYVPKWSEMYLRIHPIHSFGIIIITVVPDLLERTIPSAFNRLRGPLADLRRFNSNDCYAYSILSIHFANRNKWIHIWWRRASYWGERSIGQTPNSTWDFVFL